jgi:cystathionine beta-lyase family protein involved in aluminum resistance
LPDKFASLLKDCYGIAPELLKQAEETDEAVFPLLKNARRISELNQLKVLKAFQEENLGEGHFAGSTGYGFHDTGRETLDRALARIMRTEAALVRWQIVSGTHALSAILFGNLRPQDEWVSITGRPYDTLQPIIGGGPGSLEEWGIRFRSLDLLENGRVDFESLAFFLSPETRLVYIQRSRGYEWRPSFTIEEISMMIRRIREIRPNITVMVDNCYGEMVEESEPTEAGADVIAGSLIKNLGGGICPTGGYIAGRRELVENAARHLTAPGIGEEEGATLGINRVLAQGIFLSPLIVREALEGAILASCLLEKNGFEVSPRWDEKRTDIIQGIRLGSKESLETFCRAIQKAGPVDHRAVPTAAKLPGYRDPIVMAGGTFIQGSSIELSADGPLREPYAAYLQGGLSSAHVKIAVLIAITELHRSRASRIQGTAFGFV